MKDEMLECPVDAFLTDYLPFLPNNGLVDAAKQALMQRQLLILDAAGKLKWRHFIEEPRHGPSEEEVFAPFQEIANVFDDTFARLNGLQRHFFYRNCSRAQVVSEIGGSNFKFDACFTGNTGQAAIKTILSSDAAVIAEFKKSPKDYEDNRVKLVSAASHIMNDDPCRRWMYGITIENTEMAVWYFSRSHSVKSKTFNFITDIDTFIRVFLSFIYATREEMGYDPTVHRVDDNGWRYVYEIPTENGMRYFKTVDLLCHRRVLCVTGRKTRVWSAFEVRGPSGDAMLEKVNDKKVALKDVWLDEKSETEKQKLDEIFKRLSTIKEEDYEWAPPSLREKLKAAFEKEGYKEYFMEIECDSLGFGASKKASDRATPSPGIMRFREALDSDDGNGVEPSSTGNGGGKRLVEDRNMLAGSTQTTGSTYSEQNNRVNISDLKRPLKPKPRSYKIKQQYRLVYKEVGQSLGRVGTLDTAFSALMDAYIALVLMYLAGWMHRDVSAGNIMAVERDGGEPGGKLSDLEYAKRCEDASSSSDTKTGTAFFMPLEIHSGVPYRGRATESYSDSSGIEDNVASSKGKQSSGRNQKRDRSQHGLESLWWVGLYLLVYRVDYDGGEQFASTVFMNSPIPSSGRRELFENKHQVLTLLGEYLHPNLQHASIIDSMDEICSILMDSYYRMKPVDAKYMGRLYRRVFREFDQVVDTIKTEVEGVKFWSPSPAKEPKKCRQAETSSKAGDDNNYKEEQDEDDDADDDEKNEKGEDEEEEEVEEGEEEVLELY